MSKKGISTDRQCDRECNGFEVSGFGTRLDRALRLLGQLGSFAPDVGFFTFLRRVYRGLRRRLITKIDYSQEWYDNTYHTTLAEGKTFESYMDEWEGHGYRARLEAVFSLVPIPEREIKWLEVACMEGKSAHWFLKRYPNAHLYMFDFSRKAVEWVRANFPRDLDWELWQGDIQDIRRGEEDFSDFFDVITCIDVTEHLPGEIYSNGIREMFRVLKPGGWLILMQGKTARPEHINVLPEKRLVKDFCAAGFKFVTDLPHRHYLLSK